MFYIFIFICNFHWCYTFCTGVTLFELVLHLNCTVRSQTELGNFFMYVIIRLTTNQRKQCISLKGTISWQFFWLKVFITEIGRICKAAML